MFPAVVGAQATKVTITELISEMQTKGSSDEKMTFIQDFVEGKDAIWFPGYYLLMLLNYFIPMFVYIFLLFFGVSQYLSFIIGVVFSIVLLYFLVDASPRKYGLLLKQSLTWKLAVAMLGIMLFRMTFIASGAHLLFAQIVSSWAIPAVVIIFIIPLILGLLTGYNLGAIAVSYVLVEPFFALTSITALGCASLVFVGSLIGYLVSPLHLCNVLSSEYLKTEVTRMYHWYLPAACTVLLSQIVGVILFFSA